MTWYVSPYLLHPLLPSIQLPNPPGSLLRKVQDFILEKTGLPLFLFMGRGILQYSWGIVPHRTPIHVVIGKPIPVDKVCLIQSLDWWLVLQIYGLMALISYTIYTIYTIYSLVGV